MFTFSAYTFIDGYLLNLQRMTKSYHYYPNGGLMGEAPAATRSRTNTTARSSTATAASTGTAMREVV